MGDSHGDVTSLERVVDGTDGEEFDFVIHVGDITNAWFDGVNEGREQLEAMTPLFEALSERGELLYIWGNRDGAIGPERPFQDYDLPGTFIPDDDVIAVAGEAFTQNLESVEGDTILVNHYWYLELLPPLRSLQMKHVKRRSSRLLGAACRESSNQSHFREVGLSSVLSTL